MVSKTTVFLLFVISLAVAQDCFGEGCAHHSVSVDSNPYNSRQIGEKIQEQLRRQYWYYLRNSKLIYQANLEIDNRLLVFYFHRNLMGTFFTIASYYFNKQVSEVNTLVRLGNGDQNGQPDAYNPASIEPFTITLKDIDGMDLVISNDEQGVLDVNGETAVIVNGGDSDISAQEANLCRDLSDTFLRKNYWYYLNGAKLALREQLAAHGKVYQILTYINVVGTFLVITSCEGQEVQANTFVRLGRGAVNADLSIIEDPELLLFRN